MNRPTKPHFLTPADMYEYIKELEKYCDYLEQQVKSI